MMDNEDALDVHGADLIGSEMLREWIIYSTR